MDAAIALQLHQLATSQPGLAALVVALANYGIFLLPLSVILIWFRPETTENVRRALVVGLVSAVVAFGVGLILERTLTRPRPFVELGFQPLFPHAADSSFPSDHTLVGVALVGGLLWTDRRGGIVLLVWALIVGLARSAAGVHFPSDVLGSAVLALALDAVAWKLLQPVLDRFTLRRWDAGLRGTRYGARRQ